MKKNLFKVLSLAACVLTLTACEASVDNNPTVGDNQNETTVENETTGESGETQSATDGNNNNGISNNDKEIAKSAAPIISIEEQSHSWPIEGTDKNSLEVEMPLVTIKNAGFDALSKAFEERWRGIGSEYEELRNDALEHYNSLEAQHKEYFTPYAVSERVEVVRTDSKVISLKLYNYQYSGGVHGSYSYDGATYDVNSGKELELTDVLSDAAGFYAQAIPYIESELWATYSDNLFPDYKDWVKGTFTGEREVCWYLNASGIVIIYNTYEVGPYAMGSAEITLPYGMFGQYIKKEYTTGGDDFVAQVSKNTEFSWVMGLENALSINVREDSNYMAQVTIISGPSVVNVGTFSGLTSSYAIKRADGKCFLVIVADYMSDDMVTTVYEVTKDSVKECAKLEATSVSGNFTSAYEIEMGKRIDLLGTYIGRMTYTLGVDGSLTPKGNVFEIDMGNVLTLTEPMDVNINGKKVTLDAGREFIVIGTNDLDTIYFTMADGGESGTITFERDSADAWQININGKPESEYFDALPYVG